MNDGTHSPKVVALVPAWKASAFIERTLDSIAGQSYPNLEILISDDASADDTADICERHAAQDARFRVIRQPRNLGWCGNVNALLREARGDYYLFAFHDDLLEPSYIQCCIEVLERNPGAVLAFSDIELVEQDGSRDQVRFTALDGVTDRSKRSRLIAELVPNWWVPNRGVFRASAARTIGGLRKHLAGEYSADWPWLLHMSLLGEFVRIPECLCTKVVLDRSLSRSWSRTARAWGAVLLSSMHEVSRARIPFREKLATFGALLNFLLHPLSGRFYRQFSRSLESLAFWKSRPHDHAPRGRTPGPGRR